MNVKEQYVDITKFLNIMHYPQTKSGYTLYVRNNNNQSDDADSGEDMQLYSKALQDPEYIKNMESSYNSPKNIKRIQLFDASGSSVFVKYHTGFYLRGQRAKYEQNRNSNIQVNGKEMTLTDMLRSNITINKHIMQGAVNNNTSKDIIKYVFDNANCSNNTLLKAATYRYVASNVEEIYFGWEVLLNRKVYEAFGFTSLDQVLNMYTPEIMGTKGEDWFKLPLALRQKLMQAFSNPEAAEKIKRLFIETNLGTSSSINKRFPRLRIVGIFGCSGVYNVPRDEKQLSSYEQQTSTWYDNRKENFKKYCVPVTIIRFDGKLTEFNPGGAYKLDKEVSAHLSKQADDLRALLVKEKYTSKETADEQVKSEVERKLIELSSQYDADTLGNLVRISIDSLSATEIKAMLADFTKENRSKYAKIIGIQI